MGDLIHETFFIGLKPTESIFVRNFFPSKINVAKLLLLAPVKEQHKLTIILCRPIETGLLFMSKSLTCLPEWKAFQVLLLPLRQAPGVDLKLFLA